jgi:hypothetical protein
MLMEDAKPVTSFTIGYSEIRNRANGQQYWATVSQNDSDTAIPGSLCLISIHNTDLQRIVSRLRILHHVEFVANTRSGD